MDGPDEPELAVPASSLEAGGAPDEDVVDPTMDAGDVALSRHRLKAGTVLVDRYSILDVLGEGGMGVVYAVYDAQLDRRVALKLLRTGGERGRASDSAGEKARLLREAQAMARVNHPNVVSVYDVGKLPDGEVFAALELVEGDTLRAWMRSGPHPWQAVRGVLVDAGNGLAAVHAAGLVHRDFKPDNVLIGKDGRARLTDFGIVHAHDRVARPSGGVRAEGDAPAVGRARAFETLQTRGGRAPGTPRYMAPELFRGAVADVRSDVFSFCVAAYEALFGNEPGAKAWLSRRDRGAVAPTPEGSSVPPWLTAAVLSGLRLDPAARPASVRALLTQMGRDPRLDVQRGLLAAAGVAAFLSLLVAVTFAWRSHREQRATLCQGSAARLAGVWDGARQGDVEAAFLATHEPYAAPTLTQTLRVLSRYAEALASMYRENCEATRLRGEQSDAAMALRTSCLEERRGSLAALVDVFAHADANVVEKAGQATASLPSLRGCEDVAALAAGVPEPEDADARSRVQETRALLAHAAPLRLAGETRRARELATQALTAARGVAYLPLIADALLEAGKAHLPDAPAEAVPPLTEAVWTAQATRRDRVAAEAAVALAMASAIRSDTGALTVWTAYTRAQLTRIGGDDELEAMLESALGVNEREAAHLDRVLEHEQRAAVLFTRRFGPDDIRTLDEEGVVLMALTNLGRFAEAREKKRVLLARKEQLVGARHPATVRARLSLAFSDLTLGDLDEASRLLEPATSTEDDLEVLSRRVVWHRYVSELALQRGRYDEAIAAARRGLSILEEQSLANSEKAVELYGNIGFALSRGGRGQEAIPILAGAIARVGADAPVIAPMLMALGEAYDGAGLPREALATRERLLRLVSQDTTEATGAIEANLELEKSLVRLRPADALALVDAGHSVLEKIYGPRSVTIATSHRLRGEALLALGRAAEATTSLEASLAILVKGGFDPNARAQVSGLLARARFDTTKRAADAEPLVAEAEREYALASPPNGVERARLYRWAQSHGIATSAP